MWLGIQSNDLAGVLTAFGGLATVLSGIGLQIYLTIKQNKKIETNHVEVMNKVEEAQTPVVVMNAGSSKQETPPSTP